MEEQAIDGTLVALAEVLKVLLQYQEVCEHVLNRPSPYILNTDRQQMLKLTQVTRQGMKALYQGQEQKG